MSLINDMLRDLESRRPAGGRDALSGVSAVDRGRHRGIRLLTAATLVFTLGASAAVLWAAYRPTVGAGDTEPAVAAESSGSAVAASSEAAPATGSAEPEGKAPDPVRRIKGARLEQSAGGTALVLAGDGRLMFDLQRLEEGRHLRLSLPGTRLEASFPDLAANSALVEGVSAAPGERGVELDVWVRDGTRAQAHSRDDGTELVLALYAPPEQAAADQPAAKPAAENGSNEKESTAEAEPRTEPETPASTASAGVEDAAPSPAGGPTVSPSESPEASAFSKDRREKADASLKRLTDRARERLQAGDVGAAVGDLREVLRADAGRHEARSLLARAYMAGGRLPSAVEVLEAGLALAPEHGAFVVQLARLLAGAGQGEAALGVLDRRAPSDPGGDYHALQGALAQQLGRYEESADAYRRALRTAPERAGWWVGLAIALDGQGRAEQALKHYSTALERGGLKPALRTYAEQRVAKLRAE